jgi:hypothetical protein
LSLEEQVMSDAASVPAPEVAGDFQLQYRTLVEEAYIDPIRSVIAVDDDFPTLDAVLEAVTSEKGEWKDAKGAAHIALEILRFCRRRATPWLVDIHDGSTSGIDTLPVPHLHQSDLVILDYHLKGQEGGEQAVELLRRLAENHNFNLVVVYTNGVDGNIRDIFWSIVAGMVVGTWDGASSDSMKGAKDAIEQWEEQDEHITGKLLDIVSKEVYLRERMAPASTRGELFGALSALAKGAPQGVTVTAEGLFQWSLLERHRKVFSELSQIDLGRVNGEFTKSVNWIRLNQLFVTVIEKRRKPAELESGLLDALVKYGPSPHQLLMARMRTDMYEKGADAEAEVMGDVYLQAGWLSELVDTDRRNRARLLRATVDRHWEEMEYRLRPDIDGYADRLIDNIVARGKQQVMVQYVPVKIGAQKEKIGAHLNHFYNCTKSVDGAHLTTGHILEVPDAPPALTYWVPQPPTYWVCLSPACDLVPGQKEAPSTWTGRLGGAMPFSAVRLDRVRPSNAVREATSGDYVFFPVEAEVEAFKFSASGREQMFALNQGHFVGGQPLIEIARLSGAEGTLTLSTPITTRIVAQLRYEYALNLLQRLGSALSRVGLDFGATLQ